MTNLPNMQMPTTVNQCYSAFSFIGFLLVTIPLPWHLEAWNTGTCLYMLWAGLGCLNFFINSIIWDHNVINVAPVWCDISTRIIIAISVGIPAASLCINRRLYHIASVKSVTITKSQKRRAIMVDLAIGLGLPILNLPLAYVTQGHRFNIWEQVGCFPALVNTPVAFVFVWTWPLVIGLISAVYCSMTIRLFYKRRSQFKELLSGNDNLNSSRYFRLMCLAGIDLTCTIPLSSFAIYSNVVFGIEPWISWQNVHSNFSNVILIPALIWRNQPDVVRSLEMSRWSSVACAFIFFAFFGFADEARKNYRSAFESFAKRVGYSTGSVGSGATSTNGAKTGFPNMSSFGKGITSFGKTSLPSFVRKGTTRTTDNDSISSCTEKNSDRISIGSVFDGLKIKEFTSTATTMSSSASDSSRSPSPCPPHREPPLFTPPNHSADTPMSVHQSHDIV
jgi:pheromone a factor receptor